MDLMHIRANGASEWAIGSEMFAQTKWITALHIELKDLAVKHHYAHLKPLIYFHLLTITNRTISYAGT